MVDFGPSYLFETGIGDEFCDQSSGNRHAKSQRPTNSLPLHLGATLGYVRIYFETEVRSISLVSSEGFDVSVSFSL
jgi:hypothetical protein